MLKIIWTLKVIVIEIAGVKVKGFYLLLCLIALEEPFCFHPLISFHTKNIVQRCIVCYWGQWGGGGNISDVFLWGTAANAKVTTNHSNLRFQTILYTTFDKISNGFWQTSSWKWMKEAQHKTMSTGWKN